MKRGGILAFLIYLVLGIGAIVTLALVEYKPYVFDNIGMILLLLMVALTAAIFYVPIMVVKILHMITGWKFFSILCVIGNLFVIVSLGSSLIETSSIETILADLVLAVICLALPVIATISEIKGLKSV